MTLVWITLARGSWPAGAIGIVTSATVLLANGGPRACGSRIA
jgi:hypothetical protein